MDNLDLLTKLAKDQHILMMLPAAILVQEKEVQLQQRLFQLLILLLIHKEDTPLMNHQTLFWLKSKDNLDLLIKLAKVQHILMMFPVAILVLEKEVQLQQKLLQ
jgi:hypothetical protein